MFVFEMILSFIERSLLTCYVTEKWILSTYLCNLAAYGVLKSCFMYKQITSSYQLECRFRTSSQVRTGRDKRLLQRSLYF